MFSTSGLFIKGLFLVWVVIILINLKRKSSGGFVLLFRILYWAVSTTRCPKSIFCVLGLFLIKSNGTFSVYIMVDPQTKLSLYHVAQKYELYKKCLPTFKWITFGTHVLLQVLSPRTTKLIWVKPFLTYNLPQHFNYWCRNVGQREQSNYTWRNAANNSPKEDNNNLPLIT